MDTDKIEQVNKVLKRGDWCELEVSPNRINLMASRIGISLTSEEVVYISDNYKGCKYE